MLFDRPFVSTCVSLSLWCTFSFRLSLLKSLKISATMRSALSVDREGVYRSITFIKASLEMGVGGRGMAIERRGVKSEEEGRKEL